MANIVTQYALKNFAAWADDLDTTRLLWFTPSGPTWTAAPLPDFSSVQWNSAGGSETVESD